MIKTAAVCVAMLAFVSCGKSHSSKNSNAEIQFEKYQGTGFRTNIKLVNFSMTDKIKVDEAADLIKQVLDSKEFKNEVLNHEYNGKKTFADNLGLTNLQIYNKILQGSEKLTPDKDYEMDVTLETFYADVVTVGYTVTNTQKIWMNRKFFNRYDAADVTSNLIHEWIHKLGFTHDEEATPSRRFSVPYSVGYIVRKLAKSL